MKNSTTKNIPNKQDKRKYGFFTMFAMIVGAVIGAGIFFKNTSIMNATNSAILTLSAWVLISLIVVFMVIALLETTSSTAKSKETGTIGTWISKFYGNRSGKIMAWFYVLVYLPATLAALVQYAADQLGEGVIGWTSQSGTYLFQSTANASWIYLIVIFAISLAMLLFIGYLCNKSKSWGEQFGRATLIIKLIPIAFIIAIFVVLIVAPRLANSINQTTQYASNAPLFDIWAPSKNQWSNGASPMTIGFILALPAVMFAFDGFIYPGALQNEATNVHVFRRSMFTGIIFIAVVYILFSWAILALSNGSGYSIFSVLSALFPNQPWLALIIDLMVVLSILGGVNSLFITSIRNISSLSEEDYVIDRKGKLLKRNKNGIPENAGWILMILTIIWLLINTGFNALWTASDLYWQVAAGFNATTMNINGVSMTGGISYTGGISHAWSSVGNTWAYVDTGNVIWTMHGTDGIAEIVVVFAFFIYALIAFGGVINRSSRFDKVDVAVDEVKGYSFFAWFSLITIILISVINVYALGVEAVAAPIWLIDWFLTLVCIVLPLTFWYIFEKKVNNIDKSVLDNKHPFKQAYKQLLTIEEYISGLDTFKNKVTYGVDDEKVTKNIIKENNIKIKSFKRVNFKK